MTDPMRVANAQDTVEILLVEDNEDDASLTIEILKQKVNGSITWVEDGEEALALLRRKGKYQTAKRPSLVLLDLTLPSKSGMEVLLEMKQDPTLWRIPVIVLSHSMAERDISASYDARANCYLTKTGSLEDFQTAIEHLAKFWLSVAILPKT